MNEYVAATSAQSVKAFASLKEEVGCSNPGRDRPINYINR